MTMTAKQARAIERPVIKIGESYEFYCEIQQEYEPPEKRLRRFTGQPVTVVCHLTREEYDGPGPEDSDEDFDVSRVFVVRAQDGTEFHAHVEELNGWDHDLGQYFWVDGTHGPARDERFLVNESEDSMTHARARFPDDGELSRIARVGVSYAEAAIADVLAADNPRFDGPRFHAAAIGQPQTGRDER